MKQLQLKIHYMLCMLLLASLSVYGQSNIKEITKQHIEQNTSKHQLNTDDIKEWRITSDHISSLSGIHHIYGNQQLNGLDIYNATFSLHLTDNYNKTVAYHNKFISNLNTKISNQSSSPSITAITAVNRALQDLKLNSNNTISVFETKSKSNSSLNSLINGSDSFWFSEI